jgi:hypothetical protein
MAIDFNKISNLLIKKKDKSSLFRILVEYSGLKQKIENPDNQSWYFKQGIESNKKRLIALTREFEEIRKTFNETTIDELIQRINENLKYKSNYERNGMNTIQQMHYSSIISENEFYNELIRLKSKTELLKDIDYYLENPKEFLIFID